MLLTDSREVHQVGQSDLDFQMSQTLAALTLAAFWGAFNSVLGFRDTSTRPPYHLLLAPKRSALHPTDFKLPRGQAWGPSTTSDEMESSTCGCVSTKPSKNAGLPQPLKFFADLPF